MQRQVPAGGRRAIKRGQEANEMVSSEWVLLVNWQVTALLREARERLEAAAAKGYESAMNGEVVSRRVPRPLADPQCGWLAD